MVFKCSEYLCEWTHNRKRSIDAVGEFRSLNDGKTIDWIMAYFCPGLSEFLGNLLCYGERTVEILHTL